MVYSKHKVNTIRYIQKLLEIPTILALLIFWYIDWFLKPISSKVVSTFFNLNSPRTGDRWFEASTFSCKLVGIPRIHSVWMTPSIEFSFQICLQADLILLEVGFIKLPSIHLRLSMSILNPNPFYCQPRMLKRALFRYEVLHLRKLITLYLMIMNRLRNLTLKPSNTRELVHTSTTRELKEQLVEIQTCHRMEGIKATPLSVLSPLILHILQVLNSGR